MSEWMKGTEDGGTSLVGEVQGNFPHYLASLVQRQDRGTVARSQKLTSFVLRMQTWLIKA